MNKEQSPDFRQMTADTVGKDLLAALVAEIKLLPDVWPKLPKAKQDDVIERLQDISAEDAIAEGIERDGGGWKSYEIIHTGKHKGVRSPHAAIPNKSPLTSYRELWESLNGQGSWDLNPFVWVIQFKRIKP